MKVRPHIIENEFQSDKYPSTPRGKVPLSVKDPTAQDLLWEYAQRRRAVDAEFADDLEFALRQAGYTYTNRELIPCDDEHCWRPEDREMTPEMWKSVDPACTSCGWHSSEIDARNYRPPRVPDPNNVCGYTGERSCTCKECMRTD